VRLTIFDNADATHEWSAPVVVSAGSGAIALTATGRTDATKQYMVLRWTGASGSRSDIYRNGVRLVETPNDGRQTVSLRFQGPAAYVLKVCQAGTTTCSNEATLVFE